MYKFHLIVFIAVLLSGIMVSCSTDIDPNSDKATVLAANKADIQTYATSKGMSGSFTASSLYYYTTQASSSTVVPALGNELEFNFKLYVLYGPSNSTVTSGVTDTLVDSAYATTPTFFPFLDGALPSGLQEGFLQMREGEKAVLLIPSLLAFGATASTTPPVPANSPVRYDVYLKRARTEDQQIREYIAANKLVLTDSTTSGLRIIKTKSTSGDSVKTGQILTINYVGKQLRAKTALGFDSTRTGLNQYNVAGVNQGLLKLRVGEKATLIFPSTLGYDKIGLIVGTLYKVAPYTPLRYDIEVVSAK